MANISKAERERRAKLAEAANNEPDETPPVHEVEGVRQELSESRDLSTLPEGQEAQVSTPDADSVNDDPEPAQDPRLGTETPEWRAWKERQ